MKHVTISLLRNILGVSVLAASVALSSCETIYDDLAPCRTEYRMKFLYNRNMKFADAFAGEVESVSLWLFDTAGNMVWSGSESGEALRAEDYAMTLDVAPGTYDAIAWCGLAGGDAYYLASDKVSRKEDLILGIRRRQTDGAATVDNDLHRLYHGFERIVLAEPEGGGTVTAEMSLTTNTNAVRIMLQHLDGSPVRSEDFDFTIEESNAVMNYDNAILGNDPVLYRSWIKTETSAWFDEEDNRMYDDPDPTGGGEPGDGTLVEVNGLMAERTVGRLMADRNPQLVVTRLTDGKRIIRIPLIRYMLMVKGEYNKSMSDQDYLDRQDDYTMTFFIDSENRWYTHAGIYINSWYVVPRQETEI